jgi:hypothetical protein
MEAGFNTGFEISFFRHKNRYVFRSKKRVKKEWRCEFWFWWSKEEGTKLNPAIGLFKYKGMRFLYFKVADEVVSEIPYIEFETLSDFRGDLLLSQLRRLGVPDEIYETILRDENRKPMSCADLIPKLVKLYDLIALDELLEMESLEDGMWIISFKNTSHVVAPHVISSLKKVFGGFFKEFEENSPVFIGHGDRPEISPSQITKGCVGCDKVKYARKIDGTLCEVDDFLFSLLIDHPNKRPEDFNGYEHHMG